MSRQAKSALDFGVMSRTVQWVDFVGVSFDISTMTFEQKSGSIFFVKNLTESGIIEAVNETFPNNRIDKLISWEIRESVFKRTERDFLGGNPSRIRKVESEDTESK